jgi:hypothetical protein
MMPNLIEFPIFFQEKCFSKRTERAVPSGPERTEIPEGISI